MTTYIDTFEWAKEKHKTYTPSREVKRQLARKVMVPLVGPSAVGKSYLAKRVTELDPTFSEMTTLTTREVRPNDPDNVMAGMSMDEFTGLIEDGEMVQFDLHPSGNLYGTTVDCYTGGKIIAPILSTGIKTFQKLGFQQLTPMGVVAPRDAWSERLEERAGDGDFVDRLLEAREVLKWMEIYMHTIPILNNETNHGAEVASEIILQADNPTPGNLGVLRKRGLIIDMQNHIRDRLVEIDSNER